jgi:hypothetical protein
LFEEWDIDINKQLDAGEIDKILADLYTVAVEFLPNCEPGIKDNPELSTYLSNLTTGKNLGLAKIKAEVMKE